MSRGHWFLPDTPDVLGMLRRQVAVTIEGVDAFAAWAAGDAAAAQAVREAERRGDAAKRELLTELRAAFVTPLEPEDVFALSRAIDWILDYAGDLVSESEAMASPPDVKIAEMAGVLAEGTRHLDEAVKSLGSSAEDATAAADAVIASEWRLGGVYYDGMATLLDVKDRTDRIAYRELYRRCARIGEAVVDAAERIVYAVMKQS